LTATSSVNWGRFARKPNRTGPTAVGAVIGWCPGRGRSRWPSRPAHRP
jgi:hypothetical protein